MSTTPPLYSPFADSVKMDSNSFSGLSSLSDDQITNMLINENVVQLNSDLMGQFNITPKLMAKILLALCDRNEGQETATNNPQQQPSLQRFEEIDTLANLCREFLPSASPLTDILQAIDSESFINLNSKIINNKNFGKINSAFNRFWQFCSNLCNTEKQGISLLGIIFFGRLWSYNLDFQLGFIINCVKNQLVSKLLSAGPSGPGPGGGNAAWDLSQLVPNLESLKCQPDFDGNLELLTWKYQRLFTILIEISDSNASNKQSVTMGSIFFNQIIDLFKWPVQNCPDLVALGLLGCNTPSSSCKNEILKSTIPAFLSNHPNAAVILHTIWSTTELISSSGTSGTGCPAGTTVSGTAAVGGAQQQGSTNNQWAKKVLLQAMCDFYMKSSPEEQQQRLSRILDVAQDLKALSLLLNTNSNIFVIDLACLASRREYLKLDKWLMDKFDTHGEPFAKACIVFLNRRCSVLTSAGKGVDISGQNMNTATSLPPETLATILAVLQQYAYNATNCVTQSSPSSNQTISPELNETILTMVANSSYLLQKAPRQATPGVISNTITTKTPLLPPANPSLNDLNDRIGSLTLSGTNSFNNPTRQPFSTIQNLAPTSAAPIVSTAPNLSSQQSQQAVGPKTQRAQQQLHQTHPVSQQSQRGNVPPFIGNMFPDTSPPNPEIEKETDTYFQRIYNQSSAGSMSIDEVLEMLRRFSDSPVPHEVKVFQCMIRNLFREYCYFPQYPEKELLITAQLFGGLIQMGLIKYMPLVAGLRCVLEALKHEHGSKMYYFGIAALDRFKERLQEYPLYSHHLTTTPNFDKFPSQLIEYIQYAQQSQLPPSARNLSSLGDQRTSSSVISRSPSPGALNQNLSGPTNSFTGSSISSDSNVFSSLMMMPNIMNTQTSASGKSGLISHQSATTPIGSQLSQVQSKLFPPISNNLLSASKSTSSTSATSSTMITAATSTRSGPSIANATNIDTLLAAGDPHYQTPPESVQDKIGFIINNLSQMNLTDKAEEYKSLICDDTYYAWVSQYFVQRRVSIEHNFHTLYSNFLDVLKCSELNRLIIKETYRNIKVLLRSDKVIANFSDRTLLKNLGHWLGMMTLAKNKPILSIDLNIKFLLIEAYHKGTQELLYVVPFIAKILESCEKSTVFKPPCPWTVGILKALVELYQEPNIKLNMRFEVEVLCRNLSVDINDLIGKSTALKDEMLISKAMQEQQLGPIGGRQNILPPVSSITRPTIGDHQPPSLIGPPLSSQIHPSQAQSVSQALSMSGSVQSGLSHTSQIIKPPMHQSPPHLLTQRLPLSMMTPSLVVGPQSASLLPPHSSPSTMPIGSQHMPGSTNMTLLTQSSTIAGPAGAQFNYHDISTNNTSGLLPHIVIRNDLPLLQHHPNLKPWIKAAIERAVTEWIQPAVEKANKIALTTAERLIKKDFALEPDENRMCLAAQYLIRSLTAGMAYIASKETLLTTLTQSLIAAFTRQLGSSNGVSKELIEETAVAIANNNINLAVCFIQKTAIEKAIPELDKRLAPEYEIRRNARLEGRRYCDTNSLKYQAERMPEAIRLKVGSVPPHQFAVYEDIGRNIPGFNGPISDQPGINMTSNANSLSNLSNPLSSLIGSSGQNSLPNPVGMGQSFLKNISGGLPASMSSMQHNSTPLSGNMNLQSPIMPISSFIGENNANNIDASLQSLYEKLVVELENLFHQFVSSMQPNVLISTMHSVVELLNASRNCPTNINSAISLIQRVLEALNEIIMSLESNVSDVLMLNRARDLYLVILKALADPRAYGHQWTTKQITKSVLGRLLNQTQPPLPDEMFDILMRSELISIPLLDISMAQLIENSNSPVALAFALQFVKTYGLVVSENQIPNMISALIKVSKSSGSANLNLEIQASLDVFRGNATASVPSLGSGQGDPANFLLNASLNPSREIESDSDLMEKTEVLMRDWINLYHSNTPSSKFFHIYVQSMNQHGILKTDDSITRFFRLSTELCVNSCYRLLSHQPQNNNQLVIESHAKCFQTLDAFAHLIVMLVKNSGSNTGSFSEPTPKINLLNKVLNIIANVAIQDQEIRNEEFQHLPYYRIMIVLLMELTIGPNNLGLPSLNTLQLGFNMTPNQLDPFNETIQLQVLNAFYQALKILKPSKAPSFAFAWLDFIGCRVFMEKCLNGPTSNNNSGFTKGWSIYAPLLIEIIKFEAPFLRNVELPHSVDMLYKGTLKVLLVLLHDFPEFLCEYCNELCDAIPPNAIQMRNLVLSAYPRNMRLPDPFTPNLKIDSLSEITQPPKGTSSTLQLLANVPFRKELDSYLRTRSPVTFLCDLRGFLQNSNSTDGSNYNIPLINALVLFVGQSAIQAISPKLISMSTIAHSSHMDIFQNLAVDLDTEGRYLFLNAIANQLRYPNSHTHYFSCTLLYIFAESNQEAIQEQITRVLLERLIVNRPHPWGLLVTFIELIKNQQFKFWNHEFVRCAPEIEKLFESVARSCMLQKSQGSSNSSGQVTGELIRSQSS